MTRFDPLQPAGRARPRPGNPHAHRREVNDVNNFTRVIDAYHADRATRFEAEARHARFARGEPGADERRFRRTIGRFVVRVGARIAADPAVEQCVVAAVGGRGAPPVNSLDGVLS